MANIKILDALKKGQIPTILLGVYLVLCLGSVVLDVMAFSVPAVTAFIVTVLELALVFILKRTPIYIHCVVVLVQVVCGVIFQCLPLTIILALIYILGLVVIWIRED